MIKKGNRNMVKQRKTVPRRVSESGEDLCPVCSEVVAFYAVGTCGHFVCYRCSTRMRSLCEQMYCAICRTELPKVIFVKVLKKFEEIDTQHYLLNRRVNVYFQNDAIQDAFNKLLEHRCDLCPGLKPFRTFPGLKDHKRKEHNLHYCHLCVAELKVFTHERKSYDRKGLAQHKRIGDEDDKSHKGHPLCQFCDERFFDNDELVRHLRKEHYFCHFCDADGISNQFYSDYLVLKDHFRESHYLCEEDECEYAQFTNAFRSDIDLKAHKAAEHGRGMKKFQQRQARTVDIDIQLVPRAGAPRRNERPGFRQRREDRRDEGSGSTLNSEEPSRDAQRRGGGGGGGAQQRTKRQQRQADRDAEETARAITATMTEIQRTSNVNVVDEALLRPLLTTTTTNQNPEETYTESSADFPTLDGKSVQEEDRTSDEDVASGKDPGKSSSSTSLGKKDTMAKKVARANRFSIAESDMANDDFPSLRGEVSRSQGFGAGFGRNVNGNNSWQAPIAEEDFPSLGGSSDPQPVRSAPVKSQGMSPRNAPVRATPVEEDFPALGRPSSAKAPAVQSTWVSKPSQVTAPSKVAPKTKPAAAKPAQKSAPVAKPQALQHSASTFQDYPTLGSIGGSLTKTLSQRGGSSQEVLASAPVPSSQTMTSNVHLVKSVDDGYPSLGQVAAVITKPLKMDESDFPSLGGKGKKTTQSQSQWGPKPKEPEPEKKPEKPKGEGQFMVAKLKNKNKKKANVGSLSGDSPSGNNSPYGSDSETTKKSNTLESEPKTEVKEKTEKASANVTSVSVDTEAAVPRFTQVKSKKKKAQHTKENKTAPTVPATTEPSSKPDLRGSTANKPFSEATDASSSSLAADDFPSQTALKDQSNLPPRSDSAGDLADFPALSDAPSPAPPPGFGRTTTMNFAASSKAAPKATTTPAPPKTAPPPGFASVSPPVVPATLEPSFVVQQQPVSAPSVPPPTTTSSGRDENALYEFTQPPNFAERNQKLIAAIQRHLKDDESRFAEFKSCSGQFRTNKMGPYDYYDRCSKIIGKDNFRMIFPELLVLLPDIQKQQDLLKAHNDAMRLSKGKKTGGKNKKMAMWSTGEEPQFVSCSTCSQVILHADLTSHQKGHHIESDFPSLGSTTAPGFSYGMSAWVRAK